MDTTGKEFQQKFSRCLLYGNQLLERLSVLASSKDGTITKLIIKQCSDAFNYEWECLIKLAKTQPTCAATTFDDIMRHMDIVYRNACNDISTLSVAPKAPPALPPPPPKMPPPPPPKMPPPPPNMLPPKVTLPSQSSQATANPRDALLLELKVKLQERSGDYLNTY